MVCLAIVLVADGARDNLSSPRNRLDTAFVVLGLSTRRFYFFARACGDNRKHYRHNPQLLIAILWCVLSHLVPVLVLQRRSPGPIAAKRAHTSARQVVWTLWSEQLFSSPRTRQGLDGFVLRSRLAPLEVGIADAYPNSDVWIVRENARRRATVMAIADSVTARKHFLSRHREN